MRRPNRPYGRAAPDIYTHTYNAATNNYVNDLARNVLLCVSYIEEAVISSRSDTCCWSTTECPSYRVPHFCCMSSADLQPLTEHPGRRPPAAPG